ncbi:hypothetical protein IV203_024356 [Nitzschia inconspicua]|uniref:Radical SAM core domain-containing protein n=1 Tax=Nitzschia inconspicua TaxID=303405 RepID=A0A9K3PB00_9STRA|nr:hypothetical protein IV203_024356 [Nitzschia inconspicua]
MYTAGPLLGPALLQAAARKRGRTCEVLDLNALWIEKFRGINRVIPSDREPFVGDHDKPVDSTFLKEAEKSLYHAIASTFAKEESQRKMWTKDIKFGFLEHDEVEVMATNLAYDHSAESFGTLVLNQFALLEDNGSTPSTLGISILHAGQIIPSIAVGILARDMFPDVLIVWGGPHISGLGEEAFRTDLQRRRYASDIFVAGHAEETFVDILEKPQYRDISLGKRKVQFVPGKGGAIPYAPSFENLSFYDQPPVFPAQSTLGCAYGRCAFCTYPKMEPVPRKLDLQITVESVVEQAMEGGGTLALKDSLVTPKRLEEIAKIIAGRVKWSACTKLHPKLADVFLLATLTYNGLTTLEVGLESLLPETQRRVAKEHPPYLLEDFLAAADSAGDLAIVVNYITNFPWEDEAESIAGLDAAKGLVNYYLGAKGKVEHNSFELERQSPIAQSPAKYAICSESLRYYPWASIVPYEVM